MQRTFRDEFYTQPLPTRIPELQAELDTYLDHYNQRRPHMALEYRLCRAAEAASLGGLAPLEYLDRLRVSGPRRVSNVLTDYRGLAPMEFMAILKEGGSQSRMS